MVMANFWNDAIAAFNVGAVTDMVKCDRKASFMMWDQSGSVTEFCVADGNPALLPTANINIEVKQAYSQVLIWDTGVTVTQLSPTLKFSVNIAGSEGKTFKLLLQK